MRYVLFFLLLVGPVVAEEVYVKNRLISGPVRGAGENTMVSLEHLAKALTLQSEPVSKGYYVGRAAVLKTKGSPPTIEPGQVNVEGTVVRSEGSPPMVNLRDVATALGLEFKTDGSRIDIPVPFGWLQGDVAAPGPADSTGAAKSAAPGHVFTGGGVPIEINKNKPGATFDLDSYLAGARKTVVVFLGYYGKEKEFKEVARLVDRVAAARPDIQFLKVNVGALGSPVAQQYEIKRFPWAFFYRGRQYVGRGGGHGLLSDLKRYEADPKALNL